MEMDTDEKLDNVTSVPLISNVKKTIEIHLRKHVVENLLNANNKICLFHKVLHL